MAPEKGQRFREATPQCVRMRHSFPVDTRRVSLVGRQLEPRILLLQHGNGRGLQPVQVLIEEPRTQRVPPFVTRNKHPGTVALGQGSARAKKGLTHLPDPLPV
jgi:hypothetical protein